MLLCVYVGVWIREGGWILESIGVVMHEVLAGFGCFAGRRVDTGKDTCLSVFRRSLLRGGSPSVVLISSRVGFQS